MTNSSESLHASPRYDLEILFDVLYVLVEGSKPVSQDYLVDKTGVHNVKLKKYLEKYIKNGLVYRDKTRKRGKYELVHHGKELIYTWLDFVERFDVKDLLRNKYIEPLPEKENSKLEEIMKKTWKKPSYKKAVHAMQRAPIMMYRDFLFYLKLPKLKFKYQENIREKVNINNINYKALIEKSLEKNYIEIKFSPGYGIRKWKHSITRKKGIEIFQMKPLQIRNEKAKMKRISPYIPRQVDELISITNKGREFVNTFDKIMMEYNLTDLIYTSRNF